MAPDLNSLPPSRSISGSPSMARAISNSGDGAALRGQSPSPLSRSTSTSLQAAAAVNAGLQQEDSRRKRCSSLLRSCILTVSRTFRQPYFPKPAVFACWQTTLKRPYESTTQRPGCSCTRRNDQRGTSTIIPFQSAVSVRITYNFNWRPSS
jgi:hypothetical protein